MCIYINTEYWPEYSFKFRWKVCKIKVKKRKLIYYYLIKIIIIEYA